MESGLVNTHSVVFQHMKKCSLSGVVQSQEHKFTWKFIIITRLVASGISKRSTINWDKNDISRNDSVKNTKKQFTIRFKTMNC